MSAIMLEKKTFRVIKFRGLKYEDIVNTIFYQRTHPRTWFTNLKDRYAPVLGLLLHKLQKLHRRAHLHRKRRVSVRQDRMARGYMRRLVKIIRHELGLCPKALGGYTCHRGNDYKECE